MYYYKDKIYTPDLHYKTLNLYTTLHIQQNFKLFTLQVMRKTILIKSNYIIENYITIARHNFKNMNYNIPKVSKPS